LLRSLFRSLLQGRDLSGLELGGPVATIELLYEGAGLQAQEARVSLEETAHVGGREEVELIRLHPHQEVGPYACVVGSSLDADPATAPGCS
jgi:hypothetical protein